LLENQWQYRARSILLRTPDNAMHEDGYDERGVLQVLGVTQPGINPSLTVLFARVQPTAQYC